MIDTPTTPPDPADSDHPADELHPKSHSQFRHIISAANGESVDGLDLEGLPAQDMGINQPQRATPELSESPSIPHEEEISPLSGGLTAGWEFDALEEPSEDPGVHPQNLLLNSGQGAQLESPPPSQPQTPPVDVQTEEGHTPPSTRSRTPVPPPLGDTPQKASPALGTQGMPLPRRVDEIDVHATRVTPAAYNQPSPTQKPPLAPITRPRPGGGSQQSPLTRPPSQDIGHQSAVSNLRPVDRTPPVINRPSPVVSQVKPVLRKPRPPIDWRRPIGCILRMALLGLFALVVLIIIVGSFVLYQYYQVVASLPSVADLQQRASTFETTRIFDRNGNILYEILDPNAGRRTYVKLDQISPYLVAATIATEDKNYYSHPGFDWLAIVRAFWQNTQSGGDTVSGASTITQQLARALILTPEERGQRSYMRKVREALLAAEITRRYSKNEILELYLNEFNYGNLAYGIEAASETYFNKKANELDLSQAAFLAGLPQAPAVYDVYHNREAALNRQQQVLVLMLQASQEQSCIYVSNSQQPICVDTQAIIAAADELKNYQFNPPEVQIRYPHWVNYVRSQLEAQFDSQMIYRSGFSVYTTIDPGLQDAAEKIVKDQVASLADRHATNGALVAIRPGTGEILAMVGSADFYNDSIQGQVNMAVSPTRQPGSAIKPITYLAAFEKGWTAATLIWDVPSEFPPSGIPGDPSPPYKPVNYDGRFHGPVTVRTALANSYNIPAVKTLQFVGIFDDPNAPGDQGMIAMAKRLGITTLTRNDYGLALTLGGGEVSLLEMTGAYAVIANGGRRIPPVSITLIKDHLGNIVYQYQTPAGDQVIRPEHAFLISSILSDNDARAPMFGTNSVLNLPFPVAAKTGTTNDFRDNWTMGYTPDVAVGVWVGNADYTPMVNSTGLTGAAPIWADFMKTAVQQITGGNPSAFFKPAGIVDRVICAVSGTEPSQWCPSQRGEYFASDQLPLPKELDLWTKVLFDTWTKLSASQACGKFTSEEYAVNVTDPWAVAWIQESSEGRTWAESMGFNNPILFVPQRECRADDPRPLLSITAPLEGQTITISPLDIFGTAGALQDFDRFELSYGLGLEPVQWERLLEDTRNIQIPDKLYSWDVSKIPAGDITLHLIIHSTHDTYAELFMHLKLQVATPTSSPTPTLTPTPTFTPTPTVTSTLLPSTTPTDTATPTNTSLPPTSTNTTLPPTSTDTPTVTNTPISPTPSETPTPIPSLSAPQG